VSQNIETLVSTRFASWLIVAMILGACFAIVWSMMKTCRNSQIANYQIIKHPVERYPNADMRYELLWAFGQPRMVRWQFFRTLKAAKQFAYELEHAVRNTDGSLREKD
jgi:hypothetical protein